MTHVTDIAAVLAGGAISITAQTNGAACAVVVAGVLVVATVISMIRVRRVGGLVFWRLGRLGGSVYMSSQIALDGAERTR